MNNKSRLTLVVESIETLYAHDYLKLKNIMVCFY